MTVRDVSDTCWLDRHVLKCMMPFLKKVVAFFKLCLFSHPLFIDFLNVSVFDNLHVFYYNCFCLFCNIKIELHIFMESTSVLSAVDIRLRISVYDSH